MIGSSRSYAIGRAHFQIAGGLKSLALVCIAYIALAATGVAIFYYTNGPRGAATVGIFWVGLLLIFQAFALVIFGSLRVTAAITTDINTKMIESHRLMPVPAWRAVTGYLFGSTAHALAFAVVNGIFALAAAAVTGAPLELVVLNQALLLLFAVLVWTFTALMGLLARRAHFALMVGLSILLVAPAYMFLPGFSLLITPIMGGTIFNYRMPWAIEEHVFAASIPMQAAFMGIFFLGACRLYRGTYAATYTALQGLFLLLAWCLSSGLGLWFWNDFHFGRDAMRDPGDDFGYGQLIGSILAAMLISIIPIRVCTFKPPNRTPAWIILLVIAVSILGITVIPFGLMGDPALVAERFGITLLAVAAHVVMVYGAFRTFQKFKPVVSSLIIGGGILLLWAGPLLAELVREMVQSQMEREPSLGLIGTLSPIGLLVKSWTANEFSPPPAAGLLVQWAIAAILLRGVFKSSEPATSATETPPAATSS